MRVAVRGPIFAGKTTLAHELVEHHGFTLINYTDYLKSLAAHALSELGQPTSVADIKFKKEFYRGYLQQLGTVLGFDQGNFVDQVVAEAGNAEHIVFDNVRFIEQWQKLQPHGFVLVQLAITPMEQEVRAREAGVSPEVLGRALSHPAEVGFPVQPDEIILPHEWDLQQKVDSLLEQLRERGRAAA